MSGALDLYLTNWEGIELPPIIGTEPNLIDVTGYHAGHVVLTINEDLSIKAHIAALMESLPDDVGILREKPESTQDLEDLRPNIWDTIFVKPEPVWDLDKWRQAPETDKFQYLPNCLMKEGEDTESCVVNAQTTGVLANAYRNMCLRVGIKPMAKLHDGTMLECWRVTPIAGSQHHIPGEKSARLANSVLVNLSDSGYVDEFLEEIHSLRLGEYANESTKRRVLSRAELALTGKTGHVHNHRFVQSFFELVRGGDSEDLVRVLHDMVNDGLVLEDSIKDFGMRLYRRGIGEKAEQYLNIYRTCCGE